ncbi:hypothetical protein CR513_11080, partial [Mucuna pruriens]
MDYYSSVTRHVIPRKEFFTSYTSGDFGVSKMRNDGVTKVIGVGDVCLQTNTGYVITLVMENGNLPKCECHGYGSTFMAPKAWSYQWQRTEFDEDMTKSVGLEGLGGPMTRARIKRAKEAIQQ